MRFLQALFLHPDHRSTVKGQQLLALLSVAAFSSCQRNTI